MAENCAGMLAETALWEGDFAEAAELFAETEELSVRRVGGDDIGRHWCLAGRAEALLRLDGVPAERIPGGAGGGPRVHGTAACPRRPARPP
ncbi:hypothetical protein [Nonomuraea sp. NPDC052265]|uniref:hypothetical protein n=1 Tax=Nonomuraea sp. NPDC052265 TaxID=3364374 RepID=UPI0037C7B5AC